MPLIDPNCPDCHEPMFEAPEDLTPQVTTEDGRKFNCGNTHCLKYCLPPGISGPFAIPMY
jgi:hypothetical protein